MECPKHFKNLRNGFPMVKYVYKKKKIVKIDQELAEIWRFLYPEDDVTTS